MFKVLADIQLSKNFKLSEFRCNDGNNEVMIAPGLVEKLQALRDVLGKGIRIAAGYRSPTHNKKVGGSPNSRHLTGQAVDIKVTGVHPLDVAKAAEKIGFTGIGVYRYNGQMFTHLDVRPTKSYWCDLPNSKNLKAVKTLAEIGL